MKESREPCEICGSVGNESLIMTCFKCRETREHTYCAKVLLQSVPPIWLCEECRSSSRLLIITDVAEDLMDSETSVADCSLDPKKYNNSREECHETAKLRSNDMEDAGISLPVTLQELPSNFGNEISENSTSMIHPPSQPRTSPPAKEASLATNDTSQEKEQQSPSQAFLKKPNKIRLMGSTFSLTPDSDNFSHRNASPKRKPRRIKLMCKALKVKQDSL